MNKKNIGHLVSLFVITIFSFLGLKALFHPGLYSAHDIWHQVARLYHFSQALSDGQFFPAWIATLANGYGYPLFIFSYHLPWMIAAPLVNFGLPIFFTLKLMFFVSFLFSGYFMYWLGFYRFKDKLAALIAAIIYLWAPYHFLTIFVSASIGTAFAFACLPLIILGIEMIFDKKYQQGIALTALATTGLVLSHLMTTVMLAPLIIFWVFIRVATLCFKITKQHFFSIFLSLILTAFLTLLLTSFYILPLQKYLPEIAASQGGSGFEKIYMTNFVDFKQLLYSKWGFGPIISNAKDGEISFQIGISQWLTIFSSFIILLIVLIKRFFSCKFSKRCFFQINATYLKFALSSLLVIFSTIFLMLTPSQPVWNFASKYISLDFPFRLIILSVFFASILAAFVISSFKQIVFKIIFVVITITLALYGNRNHIRVNMYTNFPLQLYIDSEITTNTYNEYLPAKASSDLISDPAYKFDLAQTATPSAKSTIVTQYQLNLLEPQTFTFTQFSFPGQKVFVNDQQIDYRVSPHGLITVDLNSGQQTVEIKFVKPLIFQLGLTFSFLGILLVLIMLSGKIKIINKYS